MRTIFLSCGHNLGKNTPFSIYRDSGATGNGTTEYAEVKKVVAKVATSGIPGVRFVIVPEGLNLSQRIAYINKNSVDGDVCLEFHLDAGPATARGTSTWYMTGSKYAADKGKLFLAEYTNVTGLPSRHVRPDIENRLKRLAFVQDTKPLALLLELGFVTNSQDLGIIREKGAYATVSGIRKML